MRDEREKRYAFATELQYYRDRASGMLSVLATGERNAVRLMQLRGADRAIKDAQNDGTPANWAKFFKNDAIREMIERG